MSTCSTHVLDAARGRPASGVFVTLSDADGNQIGAATTDVGGRARFDPDLGPGVYELTFATGQWFEEQDRETWYPVVTLPFTVVEGETHYHVALLLSPFAYTTYRGS
ncbi:hydroxyisourate hydrolase [Nocardioides silvaticus]|uniref:5-hydroxyisourate hydrolase n=1 Tax=Nocardioides silvaticus TaxID=2201891 RepID=A0A316TRN4_9ACTN|nr:hydroxyisourate hydrolase [Nocardioides silvaticus]PWN02286.1 hydroxyisourate hydrolase [Nocardioides silvaticus]